MRYQVAANLTTSDCLIIGVFSAQKFEKLTLLNPAQQADIQAVLALGDFTGKAGSVTIQYGLPSFPAKRVILCGLGEAEKYSLAAMRKAMTTVGKALVDISASTAQIILPSVKNQNDANFLRQAVMSLEDGNVRRDQLKTKVETKYWPEKITFIGEYSQAESALKEGEIIAQAIKLTKKLANLPGNHCTPKIFAEHAREVAQANKMAIDVLDEKSITELKMGCLLAVAQGSVQPPRLVVLRYQGGASTDAPIVLVGKGITFDSGGISLKPALHMDEMKYDMCGAASVLATLQAAAQLKLPLNVIGIMALAENMPSGSAIKPGDVVTSMSGKTVEIGNTDAEGRLVLSDALTYAEQFKPKCVIDIATLTGAVIIALGAQASGLMGNDDALIKSILAASETSGERAWQLPLYEEYQELIETPFADVSNLGNNEAKSITAACFLARFAEKFSWAHLDIAGVAWQGGSNMSRYATGRPVALLVQFLLQQVK